MGKKLSWIRKAVFLDKFFWAPFIIEKDIAYYSDLQNKYRALLKCAKNAGADVESLEIIRRCSNKILEAVRRFYEGRISTSHSIIKNLIREVTNISYAVSYVNNSRAIPGSGKEIQFFRARTSERVVTFSPKDMLHIPFSMRGCTGNYRFSIPGIPSLYLGNSSYACWLELMCPSEHDFYVSPVVLDGTQKIFNLAVMTRKQWGLKDCDEEAVHCWLKLLVLMMATSYVVTENNRIFKSEYIVSQSIMLACKELGLDGVAYYSKRVYDEIFAVAAVNVALFTKFRKGREYSEICEHLKVDEAYNYAMYKQLKPSLRAVKYSDYHLKRTGLITNIGNYNRQFSYSDTEFCSFDQFLFATWKDKDSISFGNAIN